MTILTLPIHFMIAPVHKLSAFYFVLLLASSTPLLAQEDLKVLQKNWVHFSDAPNSLYKHFAGQAYQMLEERKNKVSGLNTVEDWENYQQFIKKQLNAVIGPFPEKTPLNAQILGTVKKKEYRVEHLVFESQPKFYVSASLYIPQGISGKSPVIIYCSGHTLEGYRSKTYQHVILNLVKKGFIVFAIDPVGQGERLEYLDPEKGGSLLGGATKEHSFPGAQAFIAGNSQASYMIWDGIRAVDYLMTREEVDQERIGITGRSGGGTQSSYIAAMDERIYAAAPENYITTFTRLLQTNGPQDAEQNFLHGIAQGLDQPDLLIARSPKPTLMITTTRDIFSIQGAREAANEAARMYDVLGFPNNFKMVEDDEGHASTKKNREALYAFFQEHLDLPGNPVDEEISPLSSEELKVTQTGQVSTSFDGETVFSLNQKSLGPLTAQWMDGRKEGDYLRPLDAAKKLSGFLEPDGVEAPILTGRIQRKGYVIEKNYIKGEGDYIVPYLLFIPDHANQKGILYLHPKGKSEGALEGGQIEWFVRQGFTVLAPDLVGIGEVGPESYKGDSNFEGNSYNVWFASLLLGRSIVGVQSSDLLRLSQTFKNSNGIQDIYAVAYREMGPVLLHAAAFSSLITRIALINPLISYRSIVNNRWYHPSFIQSTVPAALTSYDLPDLAASLAPKPLLMVNILDGSGKSADPTSLQDEIAVIKSAYENADSPEQLYNLKESDPENNWDFFLEWLK